jgi:hypothetical protein
MPRVKVPPTLFLFLYAGVAALLWFLAYYNTADGTRGALIGAATALTAGVAGIAGAWFTSWRSSELQEQHDYRALRRQSYGELLVALSDFRQACDKVRHWAGEKMKAGNASEKSVSNDRLLDAGKFKDQCLNVLAQTLAAVDLVGSRDVQGITDSFKEQLKDAKPYDKPVDSELESLKKDFIKLARVDVGMSTAP